MSILSRVLTNLGPPKPTGPEHLIRRYSPDLDMPISSTPDIPMKNTGIVEIEGGWRFQTTIPRVFTLFNADISHLSRGMLVYRAEIRTRNAGTAAYLEMLCRIPGQGEFFAKGTHDVIKGLRRWRVSELPFLLPSAQNPDVVSLNLVFNEPGVVEMRRVELIWKDISDPFESRQIPRTSLHIAWRLLCSVMLIALNIALIVPQLVIAVLFDWPDVFTWWPRKKGPETGRSNG